ncbi:TRAP transporter large permease [Nocardiopsis salina]|uniref:TRAP transporter large permease n=1 Tax=Nocardiopsis salina TaxID=245836 RepID=UPI000344A17D|nr:TRAP transporter large permease [Nocardiopsis salina]
MPEGIVVAIAIVVLLLFIVSEVPVWVGLLSSGAVGLLLLDGFTLTADALGTTAFSMVSNYSLFVIPMFILMGVLASNSGIAFDIYDVARRTTQKVPGGLGVATVLAAGGFSAVTGSSGATVATVGKVAVREMTRNGYRADPSAALVAAGGTLGVLIPPSIILVVYGSLTTQSIATLLLSAVVPGLLTLAAYAVTVVVLHKAGRLTLDDRSDPTDLPSGTAGADTARWKSGVASARSDVEPRTRVPRKSIAGTGYILLLFTIVIGGIYSGIFTATESGAVAAATGVVILVVRTHQRGARRTASAVLDSFKEATAMSSMIFGLLIGGSVFSYFLVKSGLPSTAAQMVDDAGLSSYALLAAALLIMLVLGFFLDSLSILIIAIPLMYPIISAEGLDPIWFGILTVKAIEVGLLTPPFGINVFVALGTSRKTTLDGIFRSVLPFIGTEIFVILLLIAFPSLTSFLPSLVGS